MIKDKHQTIEYSIRWAPLKIPEDRDIQKPSSIQLNEPAYYQLEYAASQLSELEPEDVTIKGLITGLSAKDSPLILDTSRMVNIKWFEEAEGKTYEATAILDREDYYKAIKAHEEWKSVEITGKLKQEKQNWKFISYTKFNVLA